MSRKILAASVLVIASTIGFCVQAKAETVDVPFSGTIAPKCTFSNVTAGTLATGSSSNLLEGSVSFGTQGSVDLFCNTAATVTVSEPVDNGSTGPSQFGPGYDGAIIAIGTNTAGSPRARMNSWQGVSAASLSVPAIATTNIKVSMLKDADDAAIQAGTYDFKVTVTSTP